MGEVPLYMVAFLASIRNECTWLIEVNRKKPFQEALMGVPPKIARTKVSNRGISVCCLLSIDYSRVYIKFDTGLAPPGVAGCRFRENCTGVPRP